MKALIDEVVVRVGSGRGGDGVECFVQRSPTKKVPDGGNGGKGGDVVFRADENVFDLEYFNYNKMFVADSGKPGGKSQKTGQNGKDLILKVPCGTTLTNQETGLCIRRLLVPNEQVIVAKGGRGGVGNGNKRHRKEGAVGEKVTVRLEFSYVSDACLVGFPNSGKSRFLSYVSRSKAEVTYYPFSTKIPFRGVCETETYERIVFCEIPSLMQGSAQGKGIGNKFLKHLKHAKVLLYFLDPVSEFERDLGVQQAVLREEIESFDPILLQKDVIFVVNKADQLGPADRKAAGKSLSKTGKCFWVSSESGEGVSELLTHLSEKLQKGTMHESGTFLKR